MKNAALVSVLLLASSLDVAPRCGGCGRTDHTAREFAPEVERPEPASASAADEVAQEEPAKAAPLQVAADDEAAPAEDAAAN